MKTRKYTVVLLYPDYLTEDYGGDLYIYHVAAPAIADAVKKAQERAARASEGAALVADDFKMIAVFRGFCTCCADAQGLDSER